MKKYFYKSIFCQSIFIHYPVQQWESRPNRGSWRRQRRRGRERERTHRSFLQQIWSCGTTEISCWLVSWGGGFISHFMNLKLKLLWVFFAASKRNGGCQRVRQFFAQHFSPSRRLEILLKSWTILNPVLLQIVDSNFSTLCLVFVVNLGGRMDPGGINWAPSILLNRGS